jgi:membrane-associated protease RseP (regulator of RpoE activity)
VAGVLGIVAFAVALGVAVMLHEAGHMGTAKFFGMRVRRFFVGFGPRVFSFRLGSTEYGLKAIPAGGFCEIAGMTATDELTPDEAGWAMWRYPAWKRLVVLTAGSLTHFLVAFLVLYGLAVSGLGLPNIQSKPIVHHVAACAQDQNPVSLTPEPCAPGAPTAPARDAGLRAGDRIVAVDGHTTATFTAVDRRVKHAHGPLAVTVDRGGHRQTLRVRPVPVTRVAHPKHATPGQRNPTKRASAIGVEFARTLRHGPIGAFPAVGGFTASIIAGEWGAVRHLPREVASLARSTGSGHRSPNTPVSIVGAARVGGQLAHHGLWSAVGVLFAEFNYVIGIVNLAPLVPLDGGHVAVVVYEKTRDTLRKMVGKRAGGPVDYRKLSGLTLAVILVFGAFALLTIYADVVNPVELFGG